MIYPMLNNHHTLMIMGSMLVIVVLQPYVLILKRSMILRIMYWQIVVSWLITILLKSVMLQALLQIILSIKLNLAGYLLKLSRIPSNVQLNSTAVQCLHYWRNNISHHILHVMFTSIMNPLLQILCFLQHLPLMEAPTLHNYLLVHLPLFLIYMASKLKVNLFKPFKMW